MTVYNLITVVDSEVRPKRYRVLFNSRGVPHATLSFTLKDIDGWNSLMVIETKKTYDFISYVGQFKSKKALLSHINKMKLVDALSQ